MASPAAVGGVGIGATGAGSLLSAFGAYKQGQSTSAMYGYQAGMATLNSKIALQNADYASQQGEQQAVIEGRKGAQQLGAIKANQGASGLDVNSGSTVQVQQSQRQTTQLDTQQIRSNAAKTAYDFQTQSAEDVAQAGMYTAAASNANTAGDIGALTSLVGGAASISSKWLAGTQSGMFGSNGGSYTFNGSQ